MRFVTVRCRNLLVGLSMSALLAGCGAVNHTATFAPEFTPNATTLVSVGTVTDSADPLKRSDIPADFSPSAELKSRLETKLAANGLAAATDPPGMIVLIPTIIDYDPGNAGLRWIAPGAGGTVLTVKCEIQQNGVHMGEIDSRRTIVFGGLYTIGEWKDIFGPVTDDIVDALKVKIKQGT
jgi:hypothetical protein